MRILGAARLSRKTDESTSIERQREQIELTAKVRGDSLVFITEDTDVSGAISPFLRPSLGPWLTDPEKISQWDGLLVPKVDRLTRSLSDFDEIVKWCDSHGKTLISVSESLDLNTSTGRMFANLLGLFAEFERERMSERRKDAAVKIRANGWWAGFGYPYGTKPVKVDDHWELEIDQVTYARLESIAYDILQGHSVSSIARKLDATEVATPAKGKTWRQNTIREIYTSDKCVLEPELLSQVLEALDSTKQAWTKRGDAALLLDVAFCKCGAKLHSKRYESKGRLYEYYDCSAHCGARRIPMAELDLAVWAHMTSKGGPILSAENTGGYADYPVWRKIVTGGKSAKADLIKVERKIRALDLDDPDYLSKQTELMTARGHLVETAKTETAKVDYEVIPGMTLGGYWPTLEKTAQRQLLLESGVKVSGAQRGTGSSKLVMFSIELPEDVKFVKLPDGGIAVN